MEEIKRVFQYAKPYSKNIYKALFFNVLYTFFSLFTLATIVPFVSVIFGLAEPIHVRPPFNLSPQTILDTLSYYINTIQHTYGIQWSLAFMSAMLIIASLCANVSRYLYMYFITPINANTVRDMRNDMYKKVMILPLAFYAKQHTGDIITRLNADMQEIDTLIRRSIEILLQQPFVIIVFLITLFVINPWLSLISLFLVPAVGYAAGKISVKIRQKAKKGQEELSVLSSSYEETISGIRIIKGFHAENYFSQKFNQINRHYTTTINKMLRYMELSAPLSEILTITAMLIVVFIGSTLVLKHQDISSETLILFALVFARLIPPIQSTIRAYSYVQKGIISAKRIFEVMDSDEKIIEKNNALSIKQFKDKIVFSNVHFGYESQEVLHDINITINKGDSIALVGMSGCGKSTIINLLLRLYDTTEGSISIDGNNIKDYVISDVRSLFGLVSQDIILFNDTIANNISFGNSHACREEIINAAKMADAHQFIMDMPQGYDTPIGDRGMNLSGGQRQRISIARALLSNPPILLLDEATSALDSHSEQIVQATLDKIIVDHTAVIIAHRLTTIQNADHILVLQDGKIIETGTHASLMQLNGAYSQMVNAQNINNQ